jgi:hypothetical protein
VNPDRSYCCPRITLLIEKQRLHKETRLYRKEAEDLEKKKTRLITEGAEEWDIKNAVSGIESHYAFL